MIDKIVKFPDDRVVRQETTVPYDEVKRFVYFVETAEAAGAELWLINDVAVSFKTMDEFEAFCMKLLEAK